MNPKSSPPVTMIDLIKVSKAYPPDVQAIADVSLTVTRGEIVFLTGMSGAGKTTLLRLISRMEKPTKGMVDVAGMDVIKLPQSSIHLLRRKVGMAYQDFKLLPERTVADNIAIAMEVVYRPRSFIEKRTRELLEQLDLTRKYNTRAGELSRGEQQRVSIARAVANGPEIVLADEPTGNLDAETTARVMALFEQLHRKGATLIIATHDRSLFEDTPHRVIELRFGRVLSRSEAGKDDGPAPFEAPPALFEETGA
ncbi:cell division ATP-binding protein FtsE [Desulfobulbus elongatus]|uniref:cell division ATP-binding protein FtsE n=1 Tax=Desulfobulbus elongatus TaxID=53332 RepID=UPI000A0787FB|nr:cell division ATP-binding protein FtsE [Desulfobulbus elongatus]